MARDSAPLTPAQLAAHPLLRANLPHHVGPASAPVRLAAFMPEAQAAMARMDAALAELTARLDGSPFGQLARERCSVTQLRKEADSLYDSPEARAALEHWHASRVEPEPALLDAAAVLAPDSHARALPDTPRSTAAGQRTLPHETSESSTSEVGGTREGSDTAKCVIEHANGSPLEIVRHAPAAWSAFLRKPRRSEQNVLAKARHTFKPNQSHFAPLATPSPLSSLVVAATFHSIARKPTKRTPAFALPTQSVLLRGSSTLAELRSALRLACDCVPEQVGEGTSREGDDQAEDEGATTDEEGSSTDSAGDDDVDDQVKWKNHKRVTGCVFGVGSVLYGDGDEYPKMIQTRLENQQSNLKKRKRAKVSPHSASLDGSIADSDDDCSGPAQTNERPVYTTGKLIQQVRIGELEGLQTNEPYWFMHQGNCEHIWTVDAVRYAHPNDPPLADPLDNSSTAPYPITTLLSRVSQASCRVCERDPGGVVTLDDELAGDAAALLCATCFELLHGGWGEGGVEGGLARDGTRTVPTSLDD